MFLLVDNLFATSHVLTQGDVVFVGATAKVAREVVLFPMLAHNVFPDGLFLIVTDVTH